MESLHQHNGKRSAQRTGLLVVLILVGVVVGLKVLVSFTMDGGADEPFIGRLRTEDPRAPFVRVFKAGTIPRWEAEIRHATKFTLPSGTLVAVVGVHDEVVEVRVREGLYSGMTGFVPRSWFHEE